MSKQNDSCTPINSLQHLSSAYGQSNSKTRSGVEHQIDQLLPGGSGGDALAYEFLAQKARQTAAPATFNMQAIVARRAPDVSVNWANEFHQRPYRNPLADRWANEFAERRFEINAPANELLSSQWIDEFANADHKTAKLRTSDEWARDFDSWLSGKNEALTTPLESAWSDVQQSSSDDVGKSMSLSDQWADEFAQNSISKDLTDELMEQEFNALFNSSFDRYTGFSPFEELGKEYEFSPANPYLNEENLMQRASEQLNAGNTQEAILFYEAAVQRNPEDSKAWCQLGLCHAENELDIAAISAFRKCLQIDPYNTEALLGYSVSLANESYDNEALIQLERWINTYKNGTWKLAEEATKPTNQLYNSNLDSIRFQKVESQYLEAARAQTNVDPKLQNALGVLYNLNRNFDRAIDSIKAAISQNPNDPRLWNRLGATLANSNNTAEAVEAYRHALTLFPAYVRARYNLGISCMHLNCYKEAAQHFVNALRLQKVPENSSIWSTLRSTVIRMESYDKRLMSALNDRNLDEMHQLLREI